jgi:uncharacterized protein (TIGR03437 family)
LPSRFQAWSLLLAACVLPAFARSPQAILVDGPGPWQDTQWTFTVSQFSSLLSDAGYTVTTVSPVDLSSTPPTDPSVMLAVPSLASLPVDAFNAIYAFVNIGGNLMASGGHPFSDPLYLTSGGVWLDAAAYQQTIGSPPPGGTFTPLSLYIETLWPWWEQYTNSSGLLVPITRGRGLSAQNDGSGRFRVIGDLLSPSATLLLPIETVRGMGFVNGQGLIVWLPWPQLFEPQRSQLVAALHSANNGVYLSNAGPLQILWLPGEDITGSAYVLNDTTSTINAAVQWSISGSAGVISQALVPVTVAPSTYSQIPLDLGQLSNGDYKLTCTLTLGGQQLDQLDSTVRVLDPTVTRQPDQKIHVVNGAFYAGTKRVFLQGVNYWPRNAGGLPGFESGTSWLDPDNYDPDLVEADLTEIASLNFNLVNIQYIDLQPNWQPQARSLIDFLERCRNHGIWVRIYLPATLADNAIAGTINAQLGAYLDAAYLPGNDRVFAYELLWEPYLGYQNAGGYGGYFNGSFAYNTGRALIDPAWHAWVNDQYGSLVVAQQAWGLVPPLNSSWQLTNPPDDQIQNDGPWRIMVAAYRRFADDYFGRNLGATAREIRRTDPNTLLSYRDWATMTSGYNAQMGYDIGAGAAHLDFFSPENYQVSSWPADRQWGLVTAYSRYRTGGKPVQWTVFGADIGPNYGTPSSMAAQESVCDTMMRLVNDDGSDAATVWWWPGGFPLPQQNDFGIIDPGGNLRPCATDLAQWAKTFAATPPDLGNGAPNTLTVDRDADARGSYGLFLNWVASYTQARQAGEPVVLVDQGTGTDTSTMPMIQVGNVPYAGSGPLKFVNAEFGGFQVVCPNLAVTVENNSQVPIQPGAVCQITPTLVNSGEAAWLPNSAPKGGVLLHTSLGDVPVTATVPPLQYVVLGSLSVTMGQSVINVTGRMQAQGSSPFGEVLNLTLAVDGSASGSCAISLNPTTPISAPAAGLNGAVQIMTAAGCMWSASSPQPWILLQQTSGTGAGQVGYAIPANPGPVRQTTVTIAGHSYTITQAAASALPLVQAPALSATKLNFGSLTIGMTSSAQIMTMTNSSATALTLAPVAIGGTNARDFSLTTACGSTLAPSASCAIGIAFTPSAAGARTAALFITGDVTGGSLTVALSGSGVATAPTPTIQTIVDAWNYTPGIAPGLWVTIEGSNLGAFAQTANFAGLVRLPTSLEGVTVAFNGAPAALLYVSPTQINALVPALIAPGPVQVLVQTNGVSGNPFTITATPTQPAIYALPNSDGSAFYVTAALQGTGYLIGNSAVDPRVQRPAFPGDVLDLYMLGLGSTSDPTKFITNSEFNGAFPVSAPVTVTVGGENAPVIFAGLTSPGLYLVRVSIPSDLAPGQQKIQVSTGSPSAGGAQTIPSLLLTIGTAPANSIQNASFASPLTSNLSLSTLPLKQGQIYRLQFRAKSDMPRSVTINIGGSNIAVALTRDWQRYVLYFQATDDNARAQLNFDFGNQTGNTWLDGVTLQGSAP